MPRVTKHPAFAALALLLASPAYAQDCSQLPEGPARFQCRVGKNPQAATKLERCKQEAQASGLSPRKGDPAIRNYIQACMRR